MQHYYPACEALLRQRLGFEGVTVTDYAEINNLHDWHLVAESNQEATWQRFEHSGVSQLMYLEHSDQIPHVPGTVGFSEKGPNWFFNVIDNTELHGGRRDPCFGKVTRGWELVERMHQSSGELQLGDWKELQPGYVAIQSVTIL